MDDLFDGVDFPDGPAPDKPSAEELLKNIARLLKQIGEPALCNGCGAEIWFVRHLNGKRVPYTAAGLNHFADCPQASQFRRKR